MCGDVCVSGSVCLGLCVCDDVCVSDPMERPDVKPTLVHDKMEVLLGL